MVPRTIYNRFVRWARRGVWEGLFRELVQAGDVGRSRGGRNTKNHTLADVKGRPIAILLTGGQAHDCPIAGRLIRRVKPSKCMLDDAAYDSADLREELDQHATKPVIPNRCNRELPFQLQQAPLQVALAHRDRVQQLKDFRRIATRYDRLARNYLASVCLVAALAWWL